MACNPSSTIKGVRPLEEISFREFLKKPFARACLLCAKVNTAHLVIVFFFCKTLNLLVLCQFLNRESHFLEESNYYKCSGRSFPAATDTSYCQCHFNLIQIYTDNRYVYRMKVQLTKAGAKLFEVYP